jgi:hypothetical protein
VRERARLLLHVALVNGGAGTSRRNDDPGVGRAGSVFAIFTEIAPILTQIIEFVEAAVSPI